jgi:hypothetical protein
MNSTTKTSSKFAGLISTAGLVAFVSAGCVSKYESDSRARIAFLEGQNQALMRMQGTPVQPAAGPSVLFMGAVQNPSMPYRAGLTLTQAIVGARYTGHEPTTIVIHRSGQDIPIDPKGLLNGEDFVLQVGDVIEIQ